MSPMVTGGVQNGSDVKIDVSDPETFSVPASTEMPSGGLGMVPNSTSVVGTTEIPPSKYCECNHLYYDLIDHEVMVAYCSPYMRDKLRQHNHVYMQHNHVPMLSIYVLNLGFLWGVFW